MPRWELSRQMAAKTLATAFVLVFSIAMATFPGERVHENAVARTIGLSAFLFGYEMPIRDVTPDKRGFFPNRLWLPNENLVDDTKLKEFPAEHVRGCPTLKVYALSLVNRDLTGAVLIGADLRHADFKGARVANANFDEAWLQNARFEVNAGASAQFFKTQMSKASFFKAELPGAFFQAAYLQEACLLAANLRGASLEGASLQGASLEMARLEGASLLGAYLQAASLDGAWLQGASLSMVQMQGSSIVGTQLQGVTIDRANLAGASLDSAQVWRTRFNPISMDAAKLVKLRYDPVFDAAADTTPPFDIWRKNILDTIPQGDRRTAAANGLALLDPHAKDPDAMLTRDGFWNQAVATQLSDAAYRTALAGIIEKLACAAEASPHVARGLITTRYLAEPRLGDVGAEQMPRIAERLMKGARAKPGEVTDCPGARGLTEDDLKALGELAKSAK